MIDGRRRLSRSHRTSGIPAMSSGEPGSTRAAVRRAGQRDIASNILSENGFRARWIDEGTPERAPDRTAPPGRPGTRPDAPLSNTRSPTALTGLRTARRRHPIARVKVICVAARRCTIVVLRNGQRFGP